MGCYVVKIITIVAMVVTVIVVRFVIINMG